MLLLLFVGDCLVIVGCVALVWVLCVFNDRSERCLGGEFYHGGVCRPRRVPRAPALPVASRARAAPLTRGRRAGSGARPLR
eukprot:14413009-Alexandrium_andersonii.AAC.1